MKMVWTCHKIVLFVSTSAQFHWMGGSLDMVLAMALLSCNWSVYRLSVFRWSESLNLDLYFCRVSVDGGFLVRVLAMDIDTIVMGVVSIEIQCLETVSVSGYRLTCLLSVNGQAVFG